jgi:hypothetical protein
MKSLLIGMLFICHTAIAMNVAWMPNKAGGKIVITNDTCKTGNKTYNSLNKIFMYTGEGYTMSGCFYISNNIINAIWDNGSEMKYELEDFTLYEKVAKEYKY